MKKSAAALWSPQENLKKFKKAIDKPFRFVYNTIGILRQQVPVKAQAFLPR